MSRTRRLRRAPLARGPRRHPEPGPDPVPPDPSPHRCRCPSRRPTGTARAGAAPAPPDRRRRRFPRADPGPDTAIAPGARADSGTGARPGSATRSGPDRVLAGTIVPHPPEPGAAVPGALTLDPLVPSEPHAPAIEAAATPPPIVPAWRRPAEEPTTDDAADVPVVPSEPTSDETATAEATTAESTTTEATIAEAATVESTTSETEAERDADASGGDHDGAARHRG